MPTFVPPKDDQTEVWEYQGVRTIFVPQLGADGYERRVKMSRPGQRVTVRAADRQRYSQMVTPEQNYFANGTLRRVDAPDENAVDAVSDEALRELFGKRGAGFSAGVRKLNKVNLQRLKRISEDIDLTDSQRKVLTEAWEVFFPPPQPSDSYRRLAAAGDVAVDRLS